MKKLLLGLLLTAGGFIFLSNCSQKARYENLVQSGIESGERHDTLFLGLYLGMTSEEFYKKCWDLNNQGIVRQGDGNRSVYYELDDPFSETVSVNFYPSFFDDKIAEMPVQFKYKAWAPWNKHLSDDSLQVELVRVYKDWYGPGFMEVKHKQKGTAYVKVDGNRRISIYNDQSADGSVWVLYSDLSVANNTDEKQN